MNQQSCMSKKGITFYLSSKKDIQIYSIFKQSIKDSEDYENISDFFRKQFRKYIKDNQV